jgi:hypothetical protein
MPREIYVRSDILNHLKNARRERSIETDIGGGNNKKFEGMKYTKRAYFG